MTVLAMLNPEILSDSETLCNVEAEQGLLGALLVGNSLWQRVSWLSAEDFFEPVHQRVFEAIREKSLSGEKADPVTLKAQFDRDTSLLDIGGAGYLGKLTAFAVTVLDAQAYAREIKRFSQLREISAAIKESKSLLPNGNPQEIAAALTAKLLKLSQGDYGNPAKNDFQITEEILEEIKKDSKPFSTGISKLDKATDGGFYPGKAYGICARKKCGKTMLAATISYSLAKNGTKHLFICGEMSPHEIHQRQLARDLDVYPSAFRTDYKHTLSFQKGIAEKATSSRKCIIYQNAPGLIFDNLKMYVARAITNYGIKGFILDYFQLVGGKAKNQSDASHYDEVAQWIANICRQHGIWALVTAQINQEGNTRGGEGVRLAFDQVYHMRAPEDDPSRSGRWLEMMDTRYTAWMNLGTDATPALMMHEKGTYFEEVL